MQMCRAVLYHTIVWAMIMTSTATSLTTQLQLSYSCYDPDAVNCTCTGVVSLSGQGLTGTIPGALSGCSITHLYLSSNSLSGTVPAELSVLTQMISLRVYSNDLTGTMCVVTRTRVRVM